MSSPDIKAKNPSKKSSSLKKNAASLTVEKEEKRNASNQSGPKAAADHLGSELSTSGVEVNETKSAKQKLPDPPTSPSAKSDRTPRSSGWKTSKLFSRTMSSIDVLRAFKKNQQPNDETVELKAGDNKTAKSRISSLKKKQSGSQDIAILVSEVAVDGGPGTSALQSEPVARSTRSSSQDDGIVCKKEDLISLIEASKRRPSQTSPTGRRESFQNQSSSQDVSSEDDLPTSPLKTPLTCRRSSGTSDKVPPSQSPTLQIQPDTGSSGESSLKRMNDKPEPETIEIKQSVSGITDEDDDTKNTSDVLNVETVSKVQWDDGSFVDAMMIGDAIEAFLRGSMGPVVSTEKRVSFEKSSNA